MTAPVLKIAARSRTMRPSFTPLRDSSILDRMEGGCTCKDVRYRLEDKPMIVHCCHCTWCQRETGSAFVINAVIESARVALLSGQPELVLTPSASGRGQKIMRCPRCKIALWSHYSSDALAFVRVGTLDDPNQAPPDVHIFTSTKQKWVVLPQGAKVFEEFYDIPSVWPLGARERARIAKGG